MIDSATRSLVVARAENRCEYCRLPQTVYEATFQVDHIVATQHKSDDSIENLALSCPRCNRKKGPNLAGIDPATQTVHRIFNPRTDVWTEHFQWNGPLVVGITACGRATVAVLKLNQDERMTLRQSLIDEGRFP